MNAPNLRARIAGLTALVLATTALLAAPAAAADPDLRVMVVPGDVEFINGFGGEGPEAWPTVTVDVFDAGSGAFVTTQTHTGDENGSFGGTFEFDLEPGSYRVKANAGGWSTEWYDGPARADELGLLSLYGWSGPTSFAEATILTVEADAAYPPVAAIMLFHDPSTVGGIVARWADANWDPGLMWDDEVIFVELVPAVGGNPVAVERAEGGAYSFDDVAPGEYTLRATIGAAPEGTDPEAPEDLEDAEVWWHPGTQSPSAAAAITVEPGGGHWVAANIATDTEYPDGGDAVVHADLYEGGLATVELPDDPTFPIAPYSAVENYTWTLDGVPIPGADEATLVIPAGSAGKMLAASVGTNFLAMGKRQSFSATAGTIAPATGNAFSAPVPIVTGEPIVGKTLRTDIGTWTPSGQKTFAWLRDGVPIPGETARNHVITEDDLGTTLAFRVTATRNGYMPATRVSAGVPVQLLEFDVPELAIKRPPRYGEELRIPGGWSPKPSDLTYQWFRDGEPIDGATSNVLALGSDDIDAMITATVHAAKPGYRTIDLGLAAVGPVEPGKITAPNPVQLVGAQQVGQTLSVDESAWAPAERGTTYRWQRDGYGAQGTGWRDIAGGVNSTYTLTPADAGKHVRVRLVITAEWYADLTRTSEVSAAISP